MKISNEWQTEHGHIASGAIYDKTRSVEVPFWLGVPDEMRVQDYVAAETGLTADFESLRKFGNAALELGVPFINVGHRHRQAARAMRENSIDFQVAVSSLIPDEFRVHAVGLSRGWAEVLLAGIHMPNRFDSLTAVAPAMMARIRPHRLAKIGAEMAIETARNPYVFGKVLFDSLQTVGSRPGVTMSEAAKVGIGGFVHHRVRELRTNDSDIKLHLAASAEDCFFDPDDLSRVARDLYFDTYTLLKSGSAGHMALAYDSSLSRSVIATAVESLPNRKRYIIDGQVGLDKAA